MLRKEYKHESKKAKNRQRDTDGDRQNMQTERKTDRFKNNIKKEKQTDTYKDI